jgi:4-hydroxybenzoate polyprenyltransferase
VNRTPNPAAPAVVRPPQALPIRLATWAGERFPPGTAAVVLVAYAVMMLVGRAATHPGALRLSPTDAATGLGALAFYLTVRVFDEHKDYPQDRVTHPGRALQRGVVSLGELRIVAGVALAVQVLACLWADRGVGAVGLWWAGTMAWIALAANDFFVGDRIAGHPVLQPVASMPVSSLAALWMAQTGAGPAPLPWAVVGGLAALGLLVSAGFDMARKLAPEPGGTGRSYAVALGVRPACLVLCAVLLVESTMIVTVLRMVGVGGVGPALVLLADVPAVTALLHCARTRGTRLVGRAGRMTLAAVLGQLGAVVAVLMLTRGMG